MTLVICSLQSSLLEFMMGRRTMKRTIIALSLLVAVGLSTGCNKAKDEVLPDGTGVFGERTLKDGTKTIVRVQQPNGRKDFDVTILPDRTQKIGHSEFPNGGKSFDVTILPDGTVKTGREEHPDWSKGFDVTLLPDGTKKVGRTEFLNGEKDFDLVILPGGKEKAGRIEWPDGTRELNVERMSAVYCYHDGVYAQTHGYLDRAKADFETVLAKFPASSLVDQAKQRLAAVDTTIALQGEVDLAEEQRRRAKEQRRREEQEQAELENGQPIAYVEFYVKSHTGLVIDKRYRFRAAINQDLCLGDTLNDHTHLACGPKASFDNDAEYEALLRGSFWTMGTIVASMGSDGHIQIHKVLR